MDNNRFSSNGRPKMIAFGEEFEGWDAAKKIRYLKSLASSMNDAADKMQKERNALAERVVVAEANLINCEKAMHLQKMTLTLAINEHNDSRQSDAQIIHELRTRVKAQDALIERLNGNIS